MRLSFSSRPICTRRRSSSPQNVDRTDRAAKRAADQVRQHGAPDPALPFGRADHGDALGRKNRAQRAALETKHVQRTVGAIGRPGRFGFHCVFLLHHSARTFRSSASAGERHADRMPSPVCTAAQNRTVGWRAYEGPLHAAAVEPWKTDSKPVGRDPHPAQGRSEATAMKNELRNSSAFEPLRRSLRSGMLLHGDPGCTGAASRPARLSAWRRPGQANPTASSPVPDRPTVPMTRGSRMHLKISD